jgi:predicted dehydrogenase
VRSVLPELHRHADFELVGIASRTPEKAAPLAKQYGCGAVSYGELVDHPAVDAIYIPLPTGLHAEWVARCLTAGKHVLCEKSLGCTFPEVQGLVGLAQSKRLLLMENFQFRFHSQHVAVREILKSGALGEIRCFRSSFGFPPFPGGLENIRYHRALGGGALLDAGAYTIKATTFMLGAGFRVRAATLRYGAACDVDLGGSIYLENQDGLVSETAFGFDNYYQCNYEIWGSKGKLTARRAFTAPPGLSPELVVETAGGVDVNALPPDNHFANMLTHFSCTIRRGDFGGEHSENLLQAQLLHQARKSAGNRQPV